MGLRTGISRNISRNNVEDAGLAGAFFSFYANGVFANGGLRLTVRIIPFGICRNGAARVTIEVEGGGFGGIVNEPNESPGCYLCRHESGEGEPDRKGVTKSHANEDDLEL